VLDNALLLLLMHREMSLRELMRFFREESYRKALLAVPLESVLPELLADVRRFFEGFARLSRSDQDLTLMALQTKLQTLAYSEHFQAILCATKNTLDLPQFWEEQRVLLVHMDEVLLGKREAHFLGGIVVTRLYNAMLQRPDGCERAVVLAVDEMGQIIPFLPAELLQNITTVGRSKRLRLQVATQNFSQLPAELQTRMMGSVSTRIFFRLGPQDARLVAATFSVGADTSIASVTLRTSKEAPLAEWSHEVLDSAGEPLRFTESAWSRLWSESMFVGLFDPDAPERLDGFLEGLMQLAAEQGAMRLYVRSPLDGVALPLERYLQGLSVWRDVTFEGPDPVRLVVRFPRPRVTQVKRRTSHEVGEFWTGQLLRMGNQRTATYVDGELYALRPLDMEVPDTHSEAFQSFRLAALRANGQTPEEVVRIRTEREARIIALQSSLPEPEEPVRLAAGRKVRAVPPPTESLPPIVLAEGDDGSI
jgi:hypothetical protein